MSRKEQYTIRLALQGGKAVSAEFVQVGRDGERSFERIAVSGKGASRTLGDMSKLITTRLIPALTAGFSANKIKEYSDVFKQLEGRLKVAVAESQDFAAVQEQLFNIAQNNSTPLEGVIDAYSRLSLALPDVMKQQTDMIDITDLLSKTLLISGASADGASTFFTQFGQAASSDFKAIGQELQTFADQNSFFYKILQKEATDYGKSLKDLAKEGSLSFGFIVDALNNSRSDIEANLGNIPLTIEKSLTQLDNAFLKLIGQSDLVESGTTSVAAAISTLAENLDYMAKSMALVASAMAGKYLYSLYATNAAAAAAAIQTYNVQLALAKLGGVSKVTAGSMLAFSGAMRAVNAAMALIGGPYGAAIIGTLYLMRDASNAAEGAQKTLNEQMGAFQSAATQYELASENLKRKIEDDTSARIDAYKEELIALEAIASRLDGENALFRFSRNIGSALGIDTSAEGVRQVADDVRGAIKQLEQAQGRFQDSRKRSGTFIGPLLPEDQSRVVSPSLGDASADNKAVRKAENDPSKSIDQVTEALKFQNAQLLRNEKEQQIYNELKRAGTSLNTEAGQQIKALVEEQFALNEALSQQAGGSEKATKALENYSKTARNTEQQLVDVSLNGLQSFEDSLVNIVKGTESVSEAFGNMVDSILEELIRMQIKQNITAPLSDGLNHFIGGLFGGSAEASYNTAMSRGQNNPALFGPGFAKGGITNRPAIFGEAGPEAAVPLPDGRTIPVTLSGNTGGSSVLNEINVINNNNSDVSVTESRGANGKNIINVVLDAVARDMATPGGKTNRALKNINSRRLIK